MNYIKQLNAFWKRRQLQPLSSGDVDLYMALLHFANTTGWKEEFNVPNRMLGATCGIEKSELYRRRQRLISGGLIHYRNGRKGTAGKYIIVPLYDDRGSRYPICGSNNATSVSTNTTTNNAINQGNIHKKKRENTNVNEAAATTPPQCGTFDDESVIINELWKNAGFGVMTQRTMNTLLSYLSSGMELECITYAIDEANDNNCRTLSYVRSILNRLQKDGITTKAQLADDNNSERKKLCYSEQSHKQQDLPPDDYFRIHNSWDEI